MAVIVTGGRRLKLKPGTGDALNGSRYPRAPTNGWQRRKFNVGHGGKPNEPSFLVYGTVSIQKVDANVELIRAHFDTNRSDAIRMALHLTAQAIRRNRALPELP